MKELLIRDMRFVVKYSLKKPSYSVGVFQKHLQSRTILFFPAPCQEP